MVSPPAFAVASSVTGQHGSFTHRDDRLCLARSQVPALSGHAFRTVTTAQFFKFPKLSFNLFRWFSKEPKEPSSTEAPAPRKPKRSGRGLASRTRGSEADPISAKRNIKLAPISKELERVPVAFRRPLYEVMSDRESVDIKFYNPKTAQYVYQAEAKGHGATAFDIRVGGPSTNARANKNGTFRNFDPYTSNPTWARRDWSSSEAENATREVFRQILGNAYVMEEELAELQTDISCYKSTGETKEFVRAVGLSQAYRSRYFEQMSNTRFIELNHLHFLGRAPRTQKEISLHIGILLSEGYKAEINSYVDSDEYDTLWGSQRVPQPNFRGGHVYNKDMNTLATIRGGRPRSSRVTRSAVFASGDSSYATSNSILRGLPYDWSGENMARNACSPVREFRPLFWNVQRNDMRTDELDWQARMGKNARFWYRESEMWTQRMVVKNDETDEDVESALASLKYGSTVAKNYVGVRYTWNVAPVIVMNAPSSDEATNGTISLQMNEILFAVPSDMYQPV